MCRLAAFPPMFPRRRALEILANFYAGNEDGTGSVYVKDGKFVVNKWRYSFKTVVNRKYPLLDHMPYKGWTLAHLRAASHGKIRKVNTHPFIRGEWAAMHNGVFLDYKVVKAALSPFTKFESQTDSEVAAAIWQFSGPSKFYKNMSTGTFLFLNKDGSLYVTVANGSDLSFRNLKYGTLMASELNDDMYKSHTKVLEGWFKLDAKGKIEKSSFEPDDFYSWDFKKKRRGKDDYSYGTTFSSWEDDDNDKVRDPISLDEERDDDDDGYVPIHSFYD